MAIVVREDWPGVQPKAGVLEYDVAEMRRIAGELEKALEPLKGVGAGSLDSLNNCFQLGSREMGEWQAASDLAHSVGTGGPGGPSPGKEGRGARLGVVFDMLVTHYADVVKAIRASADIYEKHDPNGVRKA
ncbi:hypothetical protein [Nonomuraea typhae]|uniref:hypothetical protein n=1 Tax=Nonomuraea typhae TaxID=2603600 RepID=UPI0012FA010C|nr:hypothetical protein [Nonomuraea typhae]